MQKYFFYLIISVSLVSFSLATEQDAQGEDRDVILPDYPESKSSLSIVELAYSDPATCGGMSKDDNLIVDRKDYELKGKVKKLELTQCDVDSSLVCKKVLVRFDRKGFQDWFESNKSSKGKIVYDYAKTRKGYLKYLYTEGEKSGSTSTIKALEYNNDGKPKLIKRNEIVRKGTYFQTKSPQIVSVDYGQAENKVTVYIKPIDDKPKEFLHKKFIYDERGKVASTVEGGALFEGTVHCNVLNRSDASVKYEKTYKDGHFMENIVHANEIRYNKQGDVITFSSHTLNAEREDINSWRKVDFSDYSYDKYGNWISRKVKYTGVYTSSREYKESRRLLYY